MCRPTDSSKWVRDAEKIRDLNADNHEVRGDWEWKIQDHCNNKYDWAADDEFWET